MTLPSLKFNPFRASLGPQRRRTAVAALLAVTVGVVLALPAGGAADQVPTVAKHHGAAPPSGEKKLTLKQLFADPPKCLEQSGFGHIALVKHDMWQGTTGSEPRTKLDDSAWVQGPFPSLKAAVAAARKDALTELAYAGGPFVVTARRASYLASETSMAAACLASLTETGYYSF